jgi:hypothetical protein
VIDATSTGEWHTRCDFTVRHAVAEHIATEIRTPATVRVS